MEDDHGAHVLEGGGEAQLTHESRPVAQLFERRVSDPGQADTREHERQHDPDDGERRPRERQHRDPPELRGG